MKKLIFLFVFIIFMLTGCKSHQQLINIQKQIDTTYVLDTVYIARADTNHTSTYILDRQIDSVQVNNYTDDKGIQHSDKIKVVYRYLNNDRSQIKSSSALKSHQTINYTSKTKQDSLSKSNTIYKNSTPQSNKHKTYTKKDLIFYSILFTLIGYCIALFFIRTGFHDRLMQMLYRIASNISRFASNVFKYIKWTITHLI